MRQVLGPGALGRPRGIGWRGRWEEGSGWGTHVNPWLVHVNVWQKPLQYCKVISLQLIKITEKKHNRNRVYFGELQNHCSCDCSHETKRRLLLGRKAMDNMDSILKSRDINLPIKVPLVKASGFSSGHVWM